MSRWGKRRRQVSAAGAISSNAFGTGFAGGTSTGWRLYGYVECFRIVDHSAKALGGAPKDRHDRGFGRRVHTRRLTLSYSCRSARVGSTLAARRAGIQQAAIVAAASSAGTPSKTIAPKGLVPTTKFGTTLRASGIASTRPIAVKTAPWFSTIRIIRAGVAPIARRIPTSRVRRLTA